MRDSKATQAILSQQFITIAEVRQLEALGCGDLLRRILPAKHEQGIALYSVAAVRELIHAGIWLRTRTRNPVLAGRSRRAKTKRRR